MTGCQYLGSAGTINLFVFPAGSGPESIAEIEEDWADRGASIDVVPDLGTRAVLIERSGQPIRYVVVQVGDGGFQLQATASREELVALAEVAASRA